MNQQQEQPLDWRDLPFVKINRLSLPNPDRPVQGWCLYLSDRWDGECPQEQDELGFVVYADKDSAYAALAAELRSRLQYYEEGRWHGSSLETGWYPMPVTWFADGHLIDSTNSEQWPRAYFTKPVSDDLKCPADRQARSVKAGGLKKVIPISNSHP